LGLDSFFGWRQGASRQDEETILRAFLLNFECLPVTTAVADRAAVIRREKRLKMPDAIILATAEVAVRKLVTRNVKDFRVRCVGFGCLIRFELGVSEAVCALHECPLMRRDCIKGHPHLRSNQCKMWVTRHGNSGVKYKPGSLESRGQRDKLLGMNFIYHDSLSSSRQDFS
jgi:PIN domain